MATVALLTSYLILRLLFLPTASIYTIRVEFYLQRTLLEPSSKCLMVEGVLQLQDGVTSVKAERFHDFAFGDATPESRDWQ